MRRCLAAVVLALLSLPASAVAQSIDLTVGLDKPTATPGEPVIAHVVIRNMAQRPIELPAALEPQYGQLRFFIRAPGAERERLFQPWAALENERTQPLAVGDDVLVTAKIFYGADGWTFPSPGDYTIRAAFGEASSMPVKLTVQEPATDSERAASRALLETQEAGVFMLLEGGDHLEQGLAVLRTVAAGQGVLSGYANLALGISQSRRFANLRTGQVRPPNLAQARELLQRSRTMLPSQSLYFQVQSQQRLAEVLRTQGETGAATQVDQQLQQNLKDNILKQNLSLPLREFAERAVN